MPYRIILEKENFKFSGTHFTIFDASHAERLHGHNYYVRTEVTVESLDTQLGMAFDFNALKPIVRDVTAELDEFVLLPALSPFLSVSRSEGAVEARFSGKSYRFPEEDVKLLPLSNITSELLATYIAGEIQERLKDRKDLQERIRVLAVHVEETRGQSVCFETTLKRAP